MKQNAKSVLAAIIAITLLSSLMSGCGKQDDSKGQDTSQSVKQESAVEQEESKKESIKQAGPKTITVMLWGNPTGVEQRQQVLDTAYPELKENYKLEAVVGGKTDVDVAQKFRLSLAAGADVPDVIFLNRTQLAEFAEAGVIEDITGQLAKYKDNMVKAAVELASYKGKMVAVPTQVKSKLWFYRKDIFDDVGIDPAKVKNEDDFIEAGKKLQEKYPQSYIWNIGPEIAAYNLGMVLSGNGAKFTNEKGEYIISTDPGVRKAFEAFKKIKESGVTVAINDFTPDWEKAFADSTIVSTLMGSWFKANSRLQKWAPDQAGKWAVSQWPEIAGSIGGSETGGGIAVFPKKAKNKEEAVDVFCRIHLTAEGGLKMYEVNSGLTPVAKDALKDPSFQKPDPYYGASLITEEARALENFMVFPFSPASDLEFKTMNMYLNKYLLTDEPLDKILKDAESDLKNQIGNPFTFSE